MNLDRRGILADLRRQLDQWRVGPERRGKVHHFDGAGSKRRRELSEKLRAVHIAHLRWCGVSWSAMEIELRLLAEKRTRGNIAAAPAG